MNVPNYIVNPLKDILFLIQNKRKRDEKDIFFEYIKYDNQVFAGRKKYHKQYENGFFKLSSEFAEELRNNIKDASSFIPHLRTRTTTSDRVIQPSLVTQTRRSTSSKKEVIPETRWPGEKSSTTIEDQYSQINIMLEDIEFEIYISKNDIGTDDIYSIQYRHEFLEQLTKTLASKIDNMIIYGKDSVKGLIPSEFHQQMSMGIQTVGGYIPLLVARDTTQEEDEFNTGNALKRTMFHLPQGYRLRSRWIMHPETANYLLKVRDSEGNEIIDPRAEKDIFEGLSVPKKLLGKEFILSWDMPPVDLDGDVPIILGDLSRGYIFSFNHDIFIRRDDDEFFTVKIQMGGQILQPASMKFVRTFDKENMPVISKKKRSFIGRKRIVSRIY